MPLPIPQSHLGSDVGSSLLAIPPASQEGAPVLLTVLHPSLLTVPPILLTVLHLPSSCWGGGVGFIQMRVRNRGEHQSMHILGPGRCCRKPNTMQCTLRLRGPRIPHNGFLPASGQMLSQHTPSWRATLRLTLRLMLLASCGVISAENGARQAGVGTS